MKATLAAGRAIGDHAYFDGGGLRNRRPSLRRTFRLRFPGLQTLPWS